MTSVTREGLVAASNISAALTELGVGRGHCIIVHSSLSSLGFVEGGADTVIDACLDTLGPAGTLVMPTLCQRRGGERFARWNIRTSPSDVGRITEVFRKRREVIRSDHATHSVAAFGPLAGTITSGHGAAHGRPGPWGDAAFATNSPWQRLYDVGARAVLIGVTFRVLTFVHLIEHLIVERRLACLNDSRRNALLRNVQGYERPGVWPYFNRDRLQREAEYRGLVRKTRCGDSTLMGCHAPSIVDLALRLMEQDPTSWFRNDFAEWYRHTGECP